MTVLVGDGVVPIVVLVCTDTQLERTILVIMCTYCLTIYCTGFPYQELLGTLQGGW